MRVYKISARSDCGSYFASYLQSVTVIASSEEEAKVTAKAWIEKRDVRFIYPESKWQVDDLGEVIDGVVDWVEDSDY